jgi:hypothetical protein
MTFSFHHSIFDLRYEFRDPGLEASKVSAAIHEAAHAIVAVALGFRAVQIRVYRRDDDLWAGVCTWDATDATDLDHILVAAAGGASNYWADSTISPARRGMKPDLWATCEHDLEGIRERIPGVSDAQLEHYRLEADSLIAPRYKAFAALVEAILESDGTLDERDICEVIGEPVPAATSAAPTTTTRTGMSSQKPVDLILSIDGNTFDRTKVRSILASKGATTEDLAWVLDGLESEARDRGMTILNGSGVRSTSTPMAYQTRRRETGMRYGDPAPIGGRQ